MKLLTPEVVRDKALQYCTEHVHDWANLDQDEQEWYIDNTMQLLLQNEDFKKLLFADQLN